MRRLGPKLRKECFLLRRRIPVDPVGLHFLIASSRDAGRDCPPACGRAAGEGPVLFGQTCPHHFDKTKRLGVNVSSLVAQSVAVEDEHHYPDIFGVVALPSAEVPGSFDFDALGAMKTGIIFVHSCGNQIRMAIVVTILHKARTIFGDGSCHEFPNHAAEIRRHQKGFHALDFFGMQLKVDES